MILYIPSTIFQINRDGSSWVEPVLSLDKCVLLKDHNAVTPLIITIIIIIIIIIVSKDSYYPGYLDKTSHALPYYGHIHSE